MLLQHCHGNETSSNGEELAAVAESGRGTGVGLSRGAWAHGRAGNSGAVGWGCRRAGASAGCLNLTVTNLGDRSSSRSRGLDLTVACKIRQ